MAGWRPTSIVSVAVPTACERPLQFCSRTDKPLSQKRRDAQDDGTGILLRKLRPGLDKLCQAGLVPKRRRQVRCQVRRQVPGRRDTLPARSVSALGPVFRDGQIEKLRDCPGLLASQCAAVGTPRQCWIRAFLDPIQCTLSKFHRKSRRKGPRLLQYG